MAGKGLRVVALLAALVAAAPALAAKKKGSGGGETPRELRHRSITIDDTSLTSLPVLHVAPGIATVLAFKVDLRNGGALLPTVTGLFYPPSQTDRTVLVIRTAPCCPSS